MTIDYEAIKDLKTDDITAKISSGEIEVPTDQTERNKFWEYASSDPDSDIRRSVLESNPDRGASSEGPVSEDPDDAETPDPEGGETGGESEAPAESEGEASGPVWKQYGYESETEALEKLGDLHSHINDLQQIVDKQNATRGKLGQKAKKMEEQLEATQKRLEELEKNAGKSKTPAFEMPEMPDLPNPSDYDDGEDDDAYIFAMGNYRKDVQSYRQKAAEFQKSLVDRMASLEQTVTGIAPTVEKTREYMESSAQTEAERENESAWNIMWEKDIPTFQKEFGVRTSIPVRRISDANGVIAKQDSYSPTEVSAAQTLLRGLSKADQEAYSKIVRMTEAYYDFSNGRPEPKYRTPRGALVDNNLMGLFPADRPARPTIDEERQHQENLVKRSEAPTGIPPEHLASGDSLNAGPETTEVLVQRFQDLQTEYNVAIDRGMSATKAFEQSPKFKEYSDLRQKLTGRPLPKYDRSTRPGFR